MMGGERGNRSASLETRSARGYHTEWEQRTILDFLRDTEIGYLDATFVVDEDVCAFDVSMNDVFLMQISEACQDLPNKVFYEGFFKGAVIPQQASEGAARHIFQENIQMFLVDA